MASSEATTSNIAEQSENKNEEAFNEFYSEHLFEGRVSRYGTISLDCEAMDTEQYLEPFLQGLSPGTVKAIEKQDSVLTSVQQIDRLLRPGSTYFNLNPFDVLQSDPDTPMSDIKKKYRQLSILVHPDKNQDDADRAQKAFEAVNKAYKTLENEEGLKRCREIIDEAKVRVDEMMKTQRKQQKKEGKPPEVPEDDPEKYKHSVYVQTCKLFADLERMRIERETKDMHERKRKAEEEAEEAERKKTETEWNKNFEESRADRVDSWRQFTTGGKSKHKKMKGTFRPPKPKVEKR